jgi:hypothetical protein
MIPTKIWPTTLGEKKNRRNQAFIRPRPELSTRASPSDEGSMTAVPNTENTTVLYRAVLKSGSLRMYLKFPSPTHTRAFGPAVW